MVFFADKFPIFYISSFVIYRYAFITISKLNLTLKIYRIGYKLIIPKKCIIF